jgi:hypothetical protein
MSPDELAYYRERALLERRSASASTDRRAADIHLELAGLYERRVEMEDLVAPTVRIVTIGHPVESGNDGLAGDRSLRADVPGA